MKIVIDLPEGDFNSIRSGVLYTIGHDKYDCIVTDAFRSSQSYEDLMGEWVVTDETDEFYGRVYKCSQCGKEMLACGCRNFCTWCGSDMRGSKDE